MKGTFGSKFEGGKCTKKEIGKGQKKMKRERKEKGEIGRPRLQPDPTTQICIKNIENKYGVNIRSS